MTRSLGSVKTLATQSLVRLDPFTRPGKYSHGSPSVDPDVVPRPPSVEKGEVPVVVPPLFPRPQG